MELDYQDIRFAIARLPQKLKDSMTSAKWQNRIFVAGGYLRCIITGEKINDIDVFTCSKSLAKELFDELKGDNETIETENAYTIKTFPAIQIIHRWQFDTATDTAKSFDFTICSAVLYYSEVWKSFCGDRFYIDLSSKRLIYTSPERNEDAGGSLLRVLKYYQRGYRIPLDSLAAVIARLMKDFNTEKTKLTDEKAVAWVINGLLREVDPGIAEFGLDSHLPSTNNNLDFEKLFE